MKRLNPQSLVPSILLVIAMAAWISSRTLITYDALPTHGEGALPMAVEAEDVYAVYNDGTEVIEAYSLTSGAVFLLSKEEYIMLLESQRKLHGEEDASRSAAYSEQVVMNRPNALIARYNEIGRSPALLRWNLKVRCSPYTENDTAHYLEQMHECEVRSKSFADRTITYRERLALRCLPDAGSSHAQSFDFELSIPPGYTMWIEYIPMMFNSYGYLSGRWIDTFLPSCTMDGVFEVLRYRVAGHGSSGVQFPAWRIMDIV